MDGPLVLPNDKQTKRTGRQLQSARRIRKVTRGSLWLFTHFFALPSGCLSRTAPESLITRTAGEGAESFRFKFRGSAWLGGLEGLGSWDSRLNGLGLSSADPVCVVAMRHLAQDCQENIRCLGVSHNGD